jgi:hypothetical protein
LIVSLIRRPLAVLAALAMAFFLALAVYTSPALTQDPETGICHIPPGNPENAHWIPSDDPAFPHHEENHPGDRTDLTEEECEGLPPDDGNGNGNGPDDGNGVTPPVVDQYDDDDGDVTIIIIKTADGDVVKVPGGKFFFKGGHKFVKAPTGKVFKVAKVVHVKKATATATAAPVQYKKTATPTAKTVVAKKTATPTAKTVVAKKTVTATPTAKTVVAKKAVKAQYVQYKAAKAQYVQYKAAPTALPPTCGSGPVLPVAIGALLLILGSGVMVLKMARSTS